MKSFKKLSELKGVLKNSKLDTEKIIKELRKEWDSRISLMELKGKKIKNIGQEAEQAEIKEALRDLHEGSR